MDQFASNIVFDVFYCSALFIRHRSILIRSRRRLSLGKQWRTTPSTMPEKNTSIIPPLCRMSIRNRIPLIIDLSLSPFVIVKSRKPTQQPTKAHFHIVGLVVQWRRLLIWLERQPVLDLVTGWRAAHVMTTLIWRQNTGAVWGQHPRFGLLEETPTTLNQRIKRLVSLHFFFFRCCSFQ